MASLRECITGPFAKILVGSEQEKFYLPKTLLAQSSTYFNAALNGQFAEAIDQIVDLEEEDPGVFRTYATWLCQNKLNAGDIEKEYPTTKEFELHIVALLAFSDRRGVKVLHEDACVMLQSYLAIVESLRPETISELYDLPESNEGHSLLRRVVVHEELFNGFRSVSRDSGQFPKEFFLELLQKLHKHGKVKQRLYAYDFLCPHNDYEERLLCNLGFLHTDRDHGRYPKPPPLPVAPEQAAPPPPKKRKR